MGVVQELLVGEQSVCCPLRSGDEDACQVRARDCAHKVFVFVDHRVAAMGRVGEALRDRAEGLHIAGAKGANGTSRLADHLEQRRDGVLLELAVGDAMKRHLRVEEGEALGFDDGVVERVGDRVGHPLGGHDAQHDRQDETYLGVAECGERRGLSGKR